MFGVDFCRANHIDANSRGSGAVFAAVGVVITLAAAVTLYVLGWMAATKSFPSFTSLSDLSALAILWGGINVLFAFCEDQKNNDRILEAIIGIALVIFGSFGFANLVNLHQLGWAVVVIETFTIFHNMVDWTCKKCNC